MTINILTTLRGFSRGALFAFIASLIASNAPAVEIMLTTAKANVSVVWYCQLLNDQLHHLACSPARPSALPWQFVRDPKGNLLLDSLDELLLVREEGGSPAQSKRFVPLFTVPYDAGSVATLARATLCNRDPACSVEIANTGFL